MNLRVTDEALSRLVQALTGAQALDPKARPGDVSPPLTASNAVPMFKLAAGSGFELSAEACRYLATRLHAYMEIYLAEPLSETEFDDALEAAAEQKKTLCEGQKLVRVESLSAKEWEALMSAFRNALGNASEHGGASIGL